MIPIIFLTNTRCLSLAFMESVKIPTSFMCYLKTRQFLYYKVIFHLENKQKRAIIFHSKDQTINIGLIVLFCHLADGTSGARYLCEETGETLET